MTRSERSRKKGKRTAPDPESPASVLTTAMLIAAQKWNLTYTELGAIIGLSASSVSRLKDGKTFLVPGTKQFELAALFVRAWVAAITHFASLQDEAREWLRRRGGTFQHVVPLEAMKTVPGLVYVCHYLESRIDRA